MNLLILGGSGLTGQHLIKLALQQGHTVKALLRTPSKVDLEDERLILVKGNVLDELILRKTLEGADAVVSALGVGNSLRSNGLIDRATQVLIPEMHRAGVRRIVFLSAFGVGDSIQYANILQRVIYRTLLRDVFADKAKGDERIMNSPLNYTIVRPVVLTTCAFTGKYKAGVFNMKGLPKIARADVADFMLGQLESSSFARREVVLHPEN